MNDLSDRLLKFAIDTIIFLRKLPYSEEMKIIKRQLIKSSTSSGANYEEAQGGSSKADFKNKVFISLKEMRESNYWLKVVEGISEKKDINVSLKKLISESEELKNILGSIVTKVSKKQTKQSKKNLGTL